MKTLVNLGLTVLGITTLLVAPNPAASQAVPSPLWGSLDQGSYAVGFASHFTVDPDRSFIEATEGAEAPGRPIRIFLWYPARPGTSQRGAGENLEFRDYLEVTPEEPRFETFSHYLQERDLDTARRQFSPTNDALFETLLNTGVAARRNAAGAAGSFPLLIHSLGLSDFQQESTVLWEFLASHGYVVAVIPQLGAGVSGGIGFTQDYLMLQTDDVDFTLDHLTTAGGPDWVKRLEVGISGDRVGIIGHSFGGIVGVMQATRDSRVAAVAGLDASFVSTSGQTLFQEMDFDLARVEAPVLNLYARAKGNLDLSPVQAMSRSDRYHIAIGGTRPPEIATHYDFQNWPLYSVLTGVEDDRGVGARPAAQAQAFYLTVCRLTRHFFDYTLKGDQGARLFLTGQKPMAELEPGLMEFRAEAKR